MGFLELMTTRVFILTLLYVAISSQTCLQAKQIPEQFESSDLVASGTITAIHNVSGDSQVYLRVSHLWKGCSFEWIHLSGFLDSPYYHSPHGCRNGGATPGLQILFFAVNTTDGFTLHHHNNRTAVFYRLFYDVEQELECYTGTRPGIPRTDSTSTCTYWPIPYPSCQSSFAESVPLLEWIVVAVVGGFVVGMIAMGMMCCCCMYSRRLDDTVNTVDKNFAELLTR
mmetsp:Transcript_21641/g.24150  ORF Transcript_21641/g.24150 Transcript_21641/m.24150 type:complete len:226 (-) Transcript_21641:107-784(-)